MLLALATVRQSGAVPIKHLRTVNPYVEAALGKGDRSRQGIWLPRQLGGLQQPAQYLATAGTSSFGMSGVNAHILLSAADGAPAAAAAGQVAIVTLPCS